MIFSDIGGILEEMAHGGIPPPYFFFRTCGQVAFPCYADDGYISARVVAYLFHHVSPQLADGVYSSLGSPGLHDEHLSLWYGLELWALDTPEDIRRKLEQAIAAMESKWKS